MPWEFWRLTPGEFQALLEGAGDRDDRVWDKVAAIGAWVLAPWSKKAIAPADLLKKRRAPVHVVRRPRKARTP